MEPNYRFEQETEDKWQAKHYLVRSKLKKLLKEHKIITKKESDIIVWIACNLPAGSELRKIVIEGLDRLDIKAKINKNQKNQSKLDL